MIEEPRAQLLIDRTWDGRPLPPAEWVHLDLTATAEGLRIAVDAPFAGEPPPPHPPGPTPGLWEYEVVELFLADADTVCAWITAGANPSSGPAYSEIELGPYGHHLVLTFGAVRRPLAVGLPITYEGSPEAMALAAAAASGSVAQRHRRWRAEALVPWQHLPAAQASALIGNAHAIRRPGDGRDRLFASLHPGPGEQPDFHQPRRLRALF